MCPNGVKFKTLGEVTRTLPKGTLKTTDLTEDGYPVINSGKSLYGYYSNFNNECEAITIAARGEYAGWISYFNEKFWAGGLCYPYTSKDENIVKTKFIYYWLKKQECNIMDNLVARGSIPALNKSDLDKFPIPLPPIEIQKKIVECLDKFSALAAELQAELHLRRKQYEYYRTQLLTPHSDCNSADNTDDAQWEWKTLGEICENCYAGATPSTSRKDFWENGTIPWMSSGEVHQGHVTSVEKYITELGFQNSSTKWVPEDSVVIALAGQGKTRGCVALTKIRLCTNQSLCALIPKKDLILPEYLYQYLKTQYMQLRNVSAGDGTRGGLNLKMIREFPIAYPSIKEQIRIVELLDKFDKLTTSLSDGIPAEQIRQQKRYEHFRDLLLTFDRKAE